MATKSYGLSVRPNQRKQYTVASSAAPVLSNRKSYGAQVENRLVISKEYPFSAAPYSLRKAIEEETMRAKRKEREYPASLFVPTRSDGIGNEYQSLKDDMLLGAGGRVVAQLFLDDYDPSAGCQREWVAPIDGAEGFTLKSDTEVVYSDQPDVELVPRERFGRRDQLFQSIRVLEQEVEASKTVATERMHERMADEDEQEPLVRLRPFFDGDLETPDDSERIIIEQETVLTEMDGMDASFILVYEHKLMNVPLLRPIFDGKQERMHQMGRMELPSLVEEGTLSSAHLENPALSSSLDAQFPGLLHDQVNLAAFERLERTRIMERMFNTSPLETSSTVGRSMTESAHVTHHVSMKRIDEPASGEILDLEPFQLRSRTYDSLDDASDEGTNLHAPYLAHDSREVVAEVKNPLLDAETTEAAHGRVNRQSDTVCVPYEPVLVSRDSFETNLHVLETPQNPHASKDVVVSGNETLQKARTDIRVLLDGATGAGSHNIANIELSLDGFETGMGQPKTRDILLTEMDAAEMEAVPVEETTMVSTTLRERERPMKLEPHESVRLDRSEVSADIDDWEASSSERQDVLIDLADLEAVPMLERVITVAREDVEQPERINHGHVVDVGKIEAALQYAATLGATIDGTESGNAENRFLSILSDGLQKSDVSRESGAVEWQRLDVAKHDLKGSEGIWNAIDSANGQRERDAVEEKGAHAVPNQISTIGEEHGWTLATPNHISAIGEEHHWTLATPSYRENYTFLEPLYGASKEGMTDLAILNTPVEAEKSIDEIEAFEQTMDGAEKIALLVDESRMERTIRQKMDRMAIVGHTDRGNTGITESDAILQGPLTASAESMQHNAIQDNPGHGVRTIIQGEAVEEHPHQIERISDTTLATEERFDSSLYLNGQNDAFESSPDQANREAERMAFQDVTFAQAERENERAAEVIDVTDRADRQHQEDAYVEDWTTAARLELVNAYLEDWAPAERRDTVQASLVRLEQMRVRNVVAVELADPLQALKTMKPASWVSPETSGRIVPTLPVHDEKIQVAIPRVKVKKKIWLIPAAGNHWNGWSRWKKTR